jgi:hypothetical protein
MKNYKDFIIIENARERVTVMLFFHKNQYWAPLNPLSKELGYNWRNLQAWLTRISARLECETLPIPGMEPADSLGVRAERLAELLFALEGYWEHPNPMRLERAQTHWRSMWADFLKGNRESIDAKRAASAAARTMRAGKGSVNASLLSSIAAQKRWSSKKVTPLLIQEIGRLLASGLSQVQTGKALNVSTTTVNLISHGKYPFDAESAEMHRKVFGASSPPA